MRPRQTQPARCTTPPKIVVGSESSGGPPFAMVELVAQLLRRAIAKFSCSVPVVRETHRFRIRISPAAEVAITEPAVELSTYESGGFLSFGVSLFGAMANGLDVVAVGIEHERAVVVGMILRAQTGSAVVAAAGGNRGLVKVVHDASLRSGE